MSSPDFAFAENPITLSLAGVEIDDPSVDMTYEVFCAGKLVYTGRRLPETDFDVSDIAREYCSPYPPPPEDRYGWCRCVQDSDAMKSRMLGCRCRVAERSCYVLPGGLSQQQLRAGRTVPVFGSGNPFLTTRAGSWIIEMKETELMPLYFASPGGIGLRVVPHCVDDFPHEDLDMDCPLGVYALDLEKCRELIFMEYGIITSVFDVYRYGDDEIEHLCARVVVTPAAPAVHRYSLRFVNSFGVPERLELIGPAEITPTVDDDDDSGTFDRYDSKLGSYVRQRVRPGLRESIKLSTGPISDNTMPLLLDALCSDDVTLEGLYDVPVAVIPQTEDLSYKLNDSAPRIISVTLELVDRESRPMPRVPASAIDVPDLFTDEFNDKFN